MSFQWSWYKTVKNSFLMCLTLNLISSFSWNYELKGIDSLLSHLNSCIMYHVLIVCIIIIESHFSHSFCISILLVQDPLSTCMSSLQYILSSSIPFSIYAPILKHTLSNSLCWYSIQKRLLLKLKNFDILFFTTHSENSNRTVFPGSGQQPTRFFT